MTLVIMGEATAEQNSEQNRKQDGNKVNKPNYEPHKPRSRKLAKHKRTVAHTHARTPTLRIFVRNKLCCAAIMLLFFILIIIIINIIAVVGGGKVAHVTTMQNEYHYAMASDDGNTSANIIPHIYIYKISHSMELSFPITDKLIVS